MLIWELFITYKKIGAFTIGGGYAMIPLISQEVVAKGWMTSERLLDFIGISESTPGPFAVNIATFIGNTTGGIIGAICATVGVVLASFIIILLIAKYFGNFKNNFYVASAMKGLRPFTLGLIVSAIYTIFVGNVFDFSGVYSEIWEIINYKNLIILGVIIAIKIKWKKIHPILLIGIGAALGIVVYYLIP